MTLKFVDKGVPQIVCSDGSEMEAQEVADYLARRGLDVICVQRERGTP